MDGIDHALTCGTAIANHSHVRRSSSDLCSTACLSLRIVGMSALVMIMSLIITCTPLDQRYLLSLVRFTYARKK